MADAERDGESRKDMLLQQAKIDLPEMKNFRDPWKVQKKKLYYTSISDISSDLALIRSHAIAFSPQNQGRNTEAN